MLFACDVPELIVKYTGVTKTIKMHRGYIGVQHNIYYRNGNECKVLLLG